jgi:RNA polymerase sigma factor (sigma-70 family)
MVLGVCYRVLGNKADAEDAFQATFLVLVRRAGGLAWPEQVSGWLHGVALRVSRKARAVRDRRPDRERIAVDPVAPDPPADQADLRRELDAELDRLPEKYRVPIVLCDLEGLTLQQTADRLGWPRGTVAGRLSRGRDLLRRRLTRRGSGLAAWPLGLVMVPAGAGPAPSDGLVSATVETVARPTGEPAALADALARDNGRPPRGVFLLALAALLALGLSVGLAWPAPPRSDPGPAPRPTAADPSVPPAAAATGCHKAAP